MWGFISGISDTDDIYYCPKQGIGIKSKLGSGYDLYILDEDMTHQYAQLHFCNIEAIDRMIELLQRMKELWEMEGRREVL